MSDEMMQGGPGPLVIVGIAPKVLGAYIVDTWRNAFGVFLIYY